MLKQKAPPLPAEYIDYRCATYATDLKWRGLLRAGSPRVLVAHDHGADVDHPRFYHWERL